jgi:hypothetical protein
MNWEQENARLAVRETVAALEEMQEAYREGLPRQELPDVLNRLEARAQAGASEVNEAADFINPGAGLGMLLRIERAWYTAEKFVQDRAW